MLQNDTIPAPVSKAIMHKSSKMSDLYNGMVFAHLS